YHTQALEIPAALFKRLAAERPDAGGTAALQVLVTMEKSSGPQLLGVARRDLYLLAGGGWVMANFIHGGGWVWVGGGPGVGLALACSTYLSGVISLLTAAFLCGASLFREFILSLATGKTFGGGPFESVYRLANRQGLVMEVNRDSAGTSVLLALDEGYRWFL